MSARATSDLAEVLSSQARFRVLEALALLTMGLRLRELERESGLAIRSVQLAVEALVQEKVLLKNEDQRFILNPKSPVASRLRGVFAFLRDEKIREQAKALSVRAREVVQLSEEMRDLVRRGARL